MIKNKCKKIVSAMLLMTMIATTFSVDVFAGGEASCVKVDIHCNGIFDNCCNNKTCKTIAEGETSIEEREFIGNTNLTSIIIADSVKSIGKEAFANCTNLKSVTIGKNVTSIGEGAFKGCVGLEFITIPKSVTEVGKEAFANCTNLKFVSHFGTCDLFSGRKNIFGNLCANDLQIKLSAE